MSFVLRKRKCSFGQNCSHLERWTQYRPTVILNPTPPHAIDLNPLAFTHSQRERFPLKCLTSATTSLWKLGAYCWSCLGNLNRTLLQCLFAQVCKQWEQSLVTGFCMRTMNFAFGSTLDKTAGMAQQQSWWCTKKFESQSVAQCNVQ